MPLAKRVVYDAVSMSAVKAILTSRASKSLCYPAMMTTEVGSVIDTCTKRVSLDEISIGEFMNHYSDIIENNYEKPSAKLLTTLVNRAVVAHQHSLFEAHAWCGSICSPQSVDAIDVAPRSSCHKYTETAAYAVSSSIVAADMARLSDALYKDGWIIQSLALRRLVIEAKNEIDDKEVTKRKERAVALIDKAIGEHSKYNWRLYNGSNAEWFNY